jgi:hypothetical protein
MLSYYDTQNALAGEFNFATLGFVVMRVRLGFSVSRWIYAHRGNQPPFRARTLTVILSLPSYHDARQTQVQVQVL